MSNAFLRRQILRKPLDLRKCTIVYLRAVDVARSILVWVLDESIKRLGVCKNETL